MPNDEDWSGPPIKLGALRTNLDRIKDKHSGTEEEGELADKALLNAGRAYKLGHVTRQKDWCDGVHDDAPSLD